MQHIMVDIETLGTKPYSVIVAIGATTGKRDFYQTLEIRNGVECGLKMDSDTVLWWLKQDEAARSVFLENEKGVKLFEALSAFGRFVPENDVMLWGNSAAFDLGLLGNAYDKLGLPRPWKYWQEGCYRTLKNVRRDIEQGPRIGVAHNALDDAKTQHEHLLRLLSAIQTDTTKQG